MNLCFLPDEAIKGFADEFGVSFSRKQTCGWIAGEDAVVFIKHYKASEAEKIKGVNVQDPRSSEWDVRDGCNGMEHIFDLVPEVLITIGAMNSGTVFFVA